MKTLVLRPLLGCALWAAAASLACDGGSDSEGSSDTESATQTGGSTSGDASTSAASDGSTSAETTEPDSASGTTTSAGEGTTTGGAETSTGELVLADIEVTVNYEGELEGRVIVAALTEWPPSGPPLASIGEDEPTFPWSGTLLALEPGEYTIFAMIDVGLNNPTQPGKEDPNTLAEMNVIVEDEGPYSVEITLEDPE